MFIASPFHLLPAPAAPTCAAGLPSCSFVSPSLCLEVPGFRSSVVPCSTSIVPCASRPRADSARRRTPRLARPRRVKSAPWRWRCRKHGRACTEPGGVCVARCGRGLYISIAAHAWSCSCRGSSAMYCCLYQLRLATAFPRVCVPSYELACRACLKRARGGREWGK